MRIIDGHVHLDTAAAAEVRGACDANGSDRYAVMSLSQYRDDPAQNLACLCAKALNPTNCYAFAGLVHPRDGERAPEYADQVKGWLEAGFDGVKLIETKPDLAKRLGFTMDDERFEEMFTLLEKSQTPVMWHVGDPATFWRKDQVPEFAVKNGWAYLDGSFPTLQALYAQTEAVLARHPRLNVALAHFYFTSDDMAHARRMLKTWPNLRLDLTPGSEMYFAFSEMRDEWRAFFEENSSRLIYGTDTEVAPDGAADTENALNARGFYMLSGNMRLWSGEGKGMGLSSAALNRVMGDNFRAYAGASPRPLRRKPALEAMRGAVELMRQRGEAEALARAEALAATVAPLL